VAAVDALRAALPEVTVRVAESVPEGVRLLLSGAPAAPADRAAREADLREQALRVLASNH
jgi:hypothetical protein